MARLRRASTTLEWPCTSKQEPGRMKRAPSSAIVARALTDVAAKDLPLCNTATFFAAPGFPSQQYQQNCAIQVDRQRGCEHSAAQCIAAFTQTCNRNWRALKCVPNAARYLDEAGFAGIYGLVQVVGARGVAQEQLAGSLQRDRCLVAPASSASFTLQQHDSHNTYALQGSPSRLQPFIRDNSTLKIDTTARQSHGLEGI